MNFSRFCTSLMVSSFAFAAAAFAQGPMPAPDTTPTQAPTPLILEEDIPVEIIPMLNTTFSFGFRRLNTGPKVRFGNLGTIPQNFLTSSDGISTIYSNGTVLSDTLQVTEKDADGAAITSTTPVKNSTDTSDEEGGFSSKTSVSNGIVNVHTNEKAADGSALNDLVTSRYRAYVDGFTRNWSYSNASQLTADGVEMSTYGAISAGGEAEAQGSSSGGFDLQLAYTLGRMGKRFEWGVSGGFSLTDFNANTRNTVVSRLMKTTDTYKLETGAGTPPLTNPALTTLNLRTNPDDPSTSVEILLSDGTTTASTLDSADQTTTVLLSIDQTPGSPMAVLRDTHSDPTWEGRTVLVDGYWQLKGAYYTLRLGPTFRYYVTERIAVSGNAGFAFSYVGSTFRANEEIVGLDVSSSVSVQDENTTQDFVPGYYADINAEFWLTERTGFYCGWGYQNLGEFTQKRLRGRSAKMDLGNSSSYRFGITTRF